jgi:hypothetical protein
MLHVLSSLTAFFTSTPLVLCSAQFLRFSAHFLVLIAFLVAVVAPRPAFATVVIPVSNSDLAKQATAIVIGKVARLQSTWDLRGHKIVTYITLTVEEVLKGIVPDSTLTIKELGGTLGDLQLWIDGNPEFTRGEKVLVFLAQNSDGSARILHFYQGKFSIFTDKDTGVEMAYRNSPPTGVHEIDGAHLRSGDSRALSERAPLTNGGFYNLETLKQQIHGIVAELRQTRGISTAPLLPVAPVTGEVVQETRSFTYLSSTAPARWFQPDSGLPVSIKINSANSPAGGSDAVRAAFQAWSNVTGSTFKYQDGGSTSSGGFNGDGINAASFGDPKNEISDPVNCSGVLAIGGYWRNGTTKVVGGKTYYQIVEGDLVFANGWEGCGFFFEKPLNMAEVATHELGHVLGLGHSSESPTATTTLKDATMYYMAHFDGRGASLRTDDINGLATIYPATTTTPTCTFTVSPTSFSVSASATTRSVTATASASSCGWTALSNASWITLTSATGGTGSTIVTFSIAANSSTSTRTGTLTVAGQTITVTQAGASSTSCSFALSKTSVSVSRSATTKSVSVYASSSTCSWTATSNASWITITSGASGTGNRTVTFAIAANTTRISRIGTLTIAGKAFTVYQRK